MRDNLLLFTEKVFVLVCLLKFHRFSRKRTFLKLLWILKVTPCRRVVRKGRLYVIFGRRLMKIALEVIYPQNKGFRYSALLFCVQTADANYQCVEDFKNRFSRYCLYVFPSSIFRLVLFREVLDF